MEVSVHTSLKHRMLGMYFLICRKVAKERILHYVDLFAGDGEAHCDEAPMKNWKCPFVKGLLEYAQKNEIKLQCYLNELDPKNNGTYDKLIKNISQYKKFIVDITREDPNIVYERALEKIPKNEWSIFFLDPFQHDHLHWSTIEKISKHEIFDTRSRCIRRPELIINLMTYSMQRSYKHNPDGITLALGNNEWKDMITTNEDNRIHEIFSDIFVANLKKLGYSVSSFEITQTPPASNVLYYMIFASSVPNACEIISKKFKPYVDYLMKDKWVKENYRTKLIAKEIKKGNTLLSDFVK